MGAARNAVNKFIQLSKLTGQCLPRASRSSPASYRSYSRSTSQPFTSYSVLTSRSHTSSCKDKSTFARAFSVSAQNSHNHLTPPAPGEELHITFIDKDGEEHTFEVAKGDNLLDIALENDIEMEGACGGSCACSTCHVIVESDELYEKIPEPDDDENDMLDLAFGLTETSRLGCQVKMTPELDGLRIKLPSMTRNLQASDFSKKSGK